MKTLRIHNRWINSGSRLLLKRSEQFIKHVRPYSSTKGLNEATEDIRNGLPDMPQCQYEPPLYKGKTLDATISNRKQFLTPALKTHYSTPLLVHAARDEWLWDENNCRYLDLIGGNVAISVGHCNEKVNDAIERQTKRLWQSSNLYLHPNVHEYAERLTEKLPENLKVCYFVNSGSEANDLAMLMARLHTGNFDLVSLRGSYHGCSPYSMGLMSMNSWRFDLANGFGIHHAMTPDPYQGLWGGHRDSQVQSSRANESVLHGAECSSADLYARQLEEICQFSIPKGKLAGLFVESIQGAAGCLQYPLGYVKKAFDLVRRNGGVCIADEVQTGFGRTGEHFWGFEGHGVVPDIVTMAKGIGNGYPLAAVVTTPEIAKTLSRANHFNTYGGNALACAVGMAVLDEIKDNKIQERAANVGEYILGKLKELRDDFDVMGDVRGKGLMLGMELVTDSSSRNPLPPDQVMQIFDDTKACGIVLGRSGINTNLLRIQPPMIISHADADYAVAVIRHCLNRHNARQEDSKTK